MCVWGARGNHVQASVGGVRVCICAGKRQRGAGGSRGGARGGAMPPLLRRPPVPPGLRPGSGSGALELGGSGAVGASARASCQRLELLLAGGPLDVSQRSDSVQAGGHLKDQGPVVRGVQHLAGGVDGDCGVEGGRRGSKAVSSQPA